MGIKGLLINTKSIGKKKNISDYKNKTVGVDGYAWLHKALFNCSIEVAINKNIKGLYDFFILKIDYFLKFNIKVVLVFDGDDLPLKNNTNLEREKNRKINLEKGMKFYKEKDFNNAKKSFGAAVDINPDMVYTLKKKLEERYNNKEEIDKLIQNILEEKEEKKNIEKLVNKKKLNKIVTKKDEQKIEIIIAPYEADSQLAYLNKINYIDLIITEDSDMLTFGGKIIFYKLDNDYNGIEYDLKKLLSLYFENWEMDKFVKFCIFLGCDYLSNPKGVGFKTAMKMINKNNEILNLLKNLEKKVEKDYLDKFLLAFLAFKYSRVFCPLKKQIVFLNNLDLENSKKSNEFEYLCFLKAFEIIGNLNFLGEKINDKIIKDIASCKIHPVNKNKFEDIYIIQDDLIKKEIKKEKFVNQKKNNFDNNPKSYKDLKIVKKEFDHLNLKNKKNSNNDPKKFFLQNNK